ncbi:MAG: hypothetical protein MJ177_01705 [Clostridia bacterium]|nr:hypothetical protein [Clostridia bacterium]
MVKKTVSIVLFVLMLVSAVTVGTVSSFATDYTAYNAKVAQLALFDFNEDGKAAIKAVTDAKEAGEGTDEQEAVDAYVGQLAAIAEVEAYYNHYDIVFLANKAVDDVVEEYTVASYSLMKGAKFEVPADPEAYEVKGLTYEFTGWSPEVSTNVSGSVTYTAQWEMKNPFEPCTHHVNKVCEIYNICIDIPIFNIIFAFVHAVIHAVK